jgi:PmbA protein
VDQLLELAAGRADQAEVFEVRREDTPVRFEANRLKMIETRQSRGIGVRLVQGGRAGLASGTHTDNPQDLVAAALEAAAAGPRALFELPDRIAGPSVETFDPAVEALALEDLIQLGQTVVDRVRRDYPEVVIEGAVTRQVLEVRLANSRGGHREYRKSIFSLYFEGLLVRGTDMLFVGDGETDCRPIWEVAPIADRIRRQLDWARENVAAPTGRLPVLFTPRAAASTLIAPLLMAMNGRTVLQGASPLAEKRGQALLDSRLSIWDDPTLPFRPGSEATDDEGIPSRRTALVERGVIGEFLYDLQTAAEAGATSTGSASRGPDTLPSPSTRCVLVDEGATALEDLIAGIKEGLIADMLIGAGQGNTLGGAFGGNVLLGFRVENGQVAGRVKDTMISGNAYEALCHVLGISREARWVGGGLRAPHFLIDDVSVASKGG